MIKKPIKLNKKFSGVKSRNGGLAIEVLVATTIVVTVFVSLITLYLNFSKVAQRNSKSIKQVFLVQEGVEIVKNLRDESWEDNISSLATGTEYYFNFTGSKWKVTTTPEVIDTVFSRSFSLDDVYRDSNDDIVLNPASGTLDPDARRVITKVSRAVNGDVLDRTITTYITNFLQN